MSGPNLFLAKPLVRFQGSLFAAQPRGLRNSTDKPFVAASSAALEQSNVHRFPQSSRTCPGSRGHPCDLHLLSQRYLGPKRETHSIQMMTRQSNVSALNTLSPPQKRAVPLMPRAPHSSLEQMARGSQVPSENVKQQTFQNYASLTNDRSSAQAHPLAQFLTLEFAESALMVNRSFIYLHNRVLYPKYLISCLHFTNIVTFQ